jgi:hypothetical protein
MKEYSVHLLVLVIVITTLFSCGDRQINPFEDETGTFSVYGALNLNDSLHYIRIRDARIPLGDSLRKELDAVVTFEDLQSGDNFQLQDSLVEFNGNFTNNFILARKLTPRHAYRIQIQRADQTSVYSIATAPGNTSAVALPDNNLGCMSPFRIRFEDITPDEQIRYSVTVEANGEKRSLELSRICPLERHQTLNQLSIDLVPLDILAAVFPKPWVNEVSCNFEFADIDCSDLDSENIEFNYLHLGPEWTEVYPIYPNDPLSIDDVQQGIGFLGAYRDDMFRISVNRF